MEEITQLKRQIEELTAWKNSLESSSSIPLNIDQSFRGRFSNMAPGVSLKSATSENRLVQEGGVQQYNVLTAPDGFLQVTLNGTTYYIPIFT